MADQITQAYPKWNIPLKQLVNTNNGDTEVFFGIGRKIISSDGSDPTKWEINEDEIGPFTTEYNRRNPNNKLTENDVRRLLIGEATNSNGAFLNERAAVINNNTNEDIRRSLAANNKIPKVTSGAVGTVSADGQQINPVTLPPSDQSNTDGTDPPPKTLQIDEDEIVSDTKDPQYENLVYPTGLGDFGQDFIKFTAYSYGGRTFNPGANAAETLSLGIGPRNFTKIEGSVSLPIQPSITDSNTVQWGGENLNPITAFAASLSFGAMSYPSQAFNEALGAAERMIKQENTSPAVRLYLAGKAVGVNGLLSRIGGGILNPNMELLFQGPQLRPFTFVFRLSAREKKEADTIRKIIRYFKQNMAVKTTADNLFLKAPNIFEIHYKQRGRNKSEDHPSLNRIKKCALQSCSVDYTPDGSYMTFNDESNTMVSYNLTLQFQELEPVTSKDYDNNLDQIGY
jgi:hypothetical protein